MSKKQAAKPAAQALAAAYTPRGDGPVAMVWRMWDELAGGEPLPRSMMIDLAVAEGVNQWTARTQAQRWLAARKAA